MWVGEAPDTTLSVSFDYSRPISAELHASLYAQYTHRSSTFSDSANSPESINKDYNQVYLRAGIENDAWSIHGFVDNLFDRDDTVFIFFEDPLTLSSYVRPRTYGVELRWNY